MLADYILIPKVYKSESARDQINRLCDGRIGNKKITEFPDEELKSRIGSSKDYREKFPNSIMNALELKILEVELLKRETGFYNK